VQGQQLAFVRVSVAAAPEVEFCVDLETDDPYTSWCLEHDWIDEPVQRAFLGLVEAGARVVDLGCHLGTFSLPAAALGAEVIAVDASPRHVELVRRAAERNGFDRLHVVHGALTDSADSVDFIERGIHGRMWVPGDPIDPTVVVQPVTVDDLLAQHGWDRVDAIKIDIEGAELTAVRGMRRLFASGARPGLVFECNGGALPYFGASIRQLRTTLADLGYELFLIDNLRPGVLVEATADGVQPECVSDYLALASRPEGLGETWVLEPPFGLEQTVARALDHAASEAEGYRLYSAELLVDGPDWLRDHPLAVPGVRALELDVSPSVRAVFDLERAPSAAVDQADAPEPASAELPADVVVLAENVAVRRASAGLERASGPGPEELALRHVSFHLRRGELLGVMADDPETAGVLLRVLAGFDPPARGRLEVEGPAFLLSEVGNVIEPSLSVGENVALLAAYLGGHVGEANRRLGSLTALARVYDDPQMPLGQLSSATVLRIVVAVVLECANSPLLLVDELPALDDADFESWAWSRAAERRQDGIAMVQVGTGHSWPLGLPNRILWIEEGEVVACGHGESILDAARGRKLGLVGAR
jgi:FkbM family methyltransferase